MKQFYQFQGLLKNLMGGTALLIAAGAVHAQAVPAPGTSPRIDAIKAAGVLRVGALSNPPWLTENTTGSGAAWDGPAWTIANEYARLLGVKLQVIPVSHETKVPVLASNQVDMTISPLAEMPERLAVADFVIYSTTSTCMFGRADNPKFSSAKKVDDLNKADVTIAYFTGGAEEAWVKQRFPNAKLRSVSSSGAPAPIEEIMAKRADAVAINRVAWVTMQSKVKGLTVLPKENNCQNSTEKAAPVGLAVDKNQPVYLAWLRQVVKNQQTALSKVEERIVKTMK